MLRRESVGLMDYVYYYRVQGSADWDKSVATVSQGGPLTDEQLDVLKQRIRLAGREYAGFVVIDLGEAPDFAGTVRV